ncbi:energy-coupling factor ABC transporter ATP-binding protein [Aquibacillus sp. 3ASR75-11]|uniref:Energy-coupling factor transporter ATP-binding protein EcfA2 n=1 Tax=Terrihalobacillus insolitus TaxID=2950438 RepID=A0A9X3WY69_9BACI|nr:energy-coupling factor ABC transporter ATP-binding protein [Terrihalobacillus insolitus]MDC3425549.1 energy-coupling factor ABC transporter ATP-binding protein [Terrihalobacillus insolitus]
MDIIFEKVSYVYQKNTPFEHQAIQNLSFHIPSGAFVAIVGHTGSGKSTVIQHLNGLLRPTKGEVRIGEYILSSDQKIKELKQLREKVGVVFQYPEHQLFEETVVKDIAFGPQNFGVSQNEIEARTKSAFEAVGLSEELRERSPFDLSGGQMRRVAIAGILAIQPEVLVLDEPTAGLDPKGHREIMSMFKRLHRENELTTILVTHSMEDALEYADHVIILDHGTKYMEGKPEEVLIQKDKLQAVQLDVPEIIQFLFRVENIFGVKIPYQGQSIVDLASELNRLIRGDGSSE